MKSFVSYSDKLNRFKEQTAWKKLDMESQKEILSCAQKFRFTFQEFRQAVEADFDFNMWDMPGFGKWWQQNIEPISKLNTNQLKKKSFLKLRTQITDIKSKTITYDKKSSFKPKPPKLKLTLHKNQDKIFGMCPVQSEKTVCCNLRTIDAVKNCAMGCSYCSIQTLYPDKKASFDENFGEKLDAIDLDPDRFYHIGTGQSSDALVWGNKNKNLELLIKFAKKWPKILLEFKTKSNNIDFFLKNQLPNNICCSWSMNPPKVIENEEHYTANLEKRLHAARALADRGIKVSFHLHPMIHYEGWRQDYSQMISMITTQFKPEEVLFVSFGTLTFSKPTLGQIRHSKLKTKVLKMEMVPNPEGKLTYPAPIKEKLFKHAFDAFSPWHDKVYFYLCMEEARFWKTTFGWVHESNEKFELDFGLQVMKKIRP